MPLYVVVWCYILICPEGETDFINLLVQRGAKHFCDVDGEVLKMAAEQLYKDRREASAKHLLPLPGQAEYMDLLRALNSLEAQDKEKQIELLEQIGEYALRKHPEMV